MHRDNWDDLRFVLAVAQNGSVSAAARALGVNHATVLRRIAAFEDRHGSEIFDKTPRGYSLPPDRARLIEAAREAEAAMLAVTRLIEGAQAPLSGTVRVTSTDTFCHLLLPPILAEMRAESGNLLIGLICSNAQLDLARLDADITVRPAPALPDDLIGESAGRLGFGVYTAPGGADMWLGLNGVLARSRPGAWITETVPSDALAATADSFLTLRELAAAGLGRAVLPCFVGDAEARLRRIEAGLPDFGVEVWVASHPDLADIPRIRAVRGQLRRSLAAQAHRLAGTAAPR